MKGIELPVFHLNDCTENLYDLNIDFDYKECDQKMVTFFNIDAIGIDTDRGRDYGMIFSGGTTFTTPYTYKELKRMLEEGQ